jgi:hypothetical protein
VVHERARDFLGRGADVDEKRGIIGDVAGHQLGDPALGIGQ